MTLEDEIREYMAATFSANEARDNPATQAAYLCAVIERDPQAFKAYKLKAAYHYMKCKRQLREAHTEPAAAFIIREMADGVMFYAPRERLLMAASVGQGLYNAWKQITQERLEHIEPEDLEGLVALAKEVQEGQEMQKNP